MKRIRGDAAAPRDFTLADLEKGITKLNRRIGDLRGASDAPYDAGKKDALESDVSSAIAEVFGPTSQEAGDFEHFELWGGPLKMGMTDAERTRGMQRGIAETITRLEGLVRRLEEKKADIQGTPAAEIADTALGKLHPRVQTVAAKLFRDGHFRQAILDSYIAVVDDVKTKSGRGDLDGTPLMQTVFSPKNPILVVSSDPDEQQGFMWLFSGAVMAIRNPKAHRLVQQADPVRAYEWLAFVSVLFRVLDDAKRAP